MGNIIKKMRYQSPYRFFWLQVFLAADMTIRPARLVPQFRQTFSFLSLLCDTG